MDKLIEEIQKRIFPYKLISKIGSGSFGVVYLARNSNQSEDIAVKCLVKQNIMDNHLEKYLWTEIETLEMMEHENIIKFHKILSTDHFYLILMEYCNGYELSAYLNHFQEQKKEINLDTARKIIRQIAEGIKHYQSKGVIHRDLKTDNILLHYQNSNDKKEFNDKFTIKIIDFGFCKKKEKDDELSSTCVGSAYNMDPRILRAQIANDPNIILNYDFEVDIWSFGIICYNILFRKINPFFATSKEQLSMLYHYGMYEIPVKSSKECIDLLINTILSNHKTRLTAEQIIGHPFLDLNRKLIFFEPSALSKLPGKYFNNDRSSFKVSIFCPDLPFCNLSYIDNLKGSERGKITQSDSSKNCDLNSEKQNSNIIINNNNNNDKKVEAKKSDNKIVNNIAKEPEVNKQDSKKEINIFKKIKSEFPDPVVKIIPKKLINQKKDIPKANQNQPTGIKDINEIFEIHNNQNEYNKNSFGKHHNEKEKPVCIKSNEKSVNSNISDDKKSNENNQNKILTDNKFQHSKTQDYGKILSNELFAKEKSKIDSDNSIKRQLSDQNTKDSSSFSSKEKQENSINTISDIKSSTSNKFKKSLDELTSTELIRYDSNLANDMATFLAPYSNTKSDTKK